MKKLLTFFCLLLVSACASLDSSSAESYSELSSPRPVMQALAVTTVTPVGTPTANQVQTALAVIALDGATSTAASAATGTAYAVTSTSAANATEAFWVNVTLGVATERGNETKSAGTQAAGTQQADWKTQQPQTQTALISTQTVEQNELHSKIVQTWILNVGGAFVLLAFLWLGWLALREAYHQWKEREAAKVMKQRQEALARDAQGRGPIVGSSSLKANEILINTDLMHRAGFDPTKGDDLTTEQALGNANAQRKLEGIRNITNSPAVGSLLKRVMKEEQAAAKKPTTDVVITKPDQPLLTQMGIDEIVDADWQTNQQHRD